MSKDLIIIFLGAWVVLVPFLGFPSKWDTVIFVVSGLLIISLMFMLRKDFVRQISRIKSRSPLHDEHVFEEAVIAPELLQKVDKEVEGELEIEEPIPPPHVHHHTPPPPPHHAKHVSAVKRKSKKLKINEEVQEAV